MRETMRSVVCTAIAMMCANLRAQTPPPGVIPMDDPGRVRLEDWSLIDLIAAAYSARATQVSGPAWLSGRGFDIEAKVPAGTRKEELNAMLQYLLKERFDLKVHWLRRPGRALRWWWAKAGPS